MKRIICILAAFFTLLSCGKEKEEAVVVNFSREELSEQVQLHDADPIVLEDTYNNPLFYWVLQDSIVLANNQSGSDCFLEFFSLRTRKRLLGVGTHGNGPDEFLNLTAFVPDCHSDTLFAIDLKRSLYFEIDWKKTLAQKKLVIVRNFRYSSQSHPQILPCILTDSTYLAYNFWYSPDSAHPNGIPEFQIYPMEAPSTMETEFLTLRPDMEYFPAEVNGAHLFRPFGKEIWAADCHLPRLRLYDDSLHLVKEIKGPDVYEPEYEATKSNIPIWYLKFANSQTRLSYTAWSVTHTHVYLIYNGWDGVHFMDETIPPIEVYVFSPKGIPMACYQLDRFCTNLSVDEKNGFLYASTKKSVGDATELVRYRLKNIGSNLHP